MNREAAREEIKQRISCTDFLQKSKRGKYCCPFCGSGNGPNATGALNYYPDTNTWHCFVCGKSGDVIHLYQFLNDTDHNEALSLLADDLGITIEAYQPAAAETGTGGHRSDFSPQDKESIYPSHKNAQNGEKTPVETIADYTEYYKECRKRINDPVAAAYLQKRGISIETAAAYWIGFDPAADPAQSNHPCPRIIIPTSTGHYVGRRVDGIKDYAKINSKGSTPAIFNARALYAQEVQEVFVVEGAFDALSIIETGAAAIALNSAGNFDKLIKRLEEQPTAATLVLCPDNDKDPKTAASVKKNFDKLRQGLQQLNISYITADINGGYKDANEHLTANKESFAAAIDKARRQNAVKPDNTAFYIDTIMSEDIARFKNDKKTGFNNLDKNAGGLYSGLYVLAAISSLGKTSFALQLADQLAERGNDIIFFSLEQSKLELVSKSIARRTAQNDINTAVTSLAIRKGFLPQRVLAAVQEYKKAVSDRISIVEGNFNCNISFIGDNIRQYVRRSNTRPVVFIDYLQILQPAETVQRQSTKEVIDNTITELKRISRDLDLTVFVVSSVNRTNYMQPIDFESLKESGGIEYTADVVWGLQLQCLNEELFTQDKKIKEKRARIKQAKAENPRKIELVCLKNRYGIANYSCYFEYYPAADLFKEQSAAETDFDPAQEDKWKNAKVR